MTQIELFPGYRYASASAEALAERLSPPYDRIPPALRATLWERHEENAVRVILPPPGDSGTDLMTQASTDEGWYQGAADRFNSWIESGKIQADEPAIYPYRQEFELDGKPYTRWGFFAALRLDPEHRALAHEQTFEGPKADRLRLTTACKANLSPIFVIFDDPDGDLKTAAERQKEPVAQSRTDDGIRHTLFAERDEETTGRLKRVMESQQVCIADGHHRYETALRYLEVASQDKKLDDSHPAHWVLAFFCPVQDPGLVVLPTHRLVSDLPVDWMNHLESNLPRPWSAVQLDSDDACATALEASSLENMVIGVSDGNRHLCLSAPRHAVAEAMTDQPEPLRGLEVIALHHLILRQVLGLAEAKPGQIRYIKEIGTILEDARTENAADGNVGAFLLPPVSVYDVRAASVRGCRMPPKSTDFFPKLPTGLLFRLLHD